MATSSRIAAACVISVIALGCGGDDRGLTPVSGKVTFSGGPCPAEGNITFTPLDAAPGTSRPATAHFGVDGEYQATSFTAGDGLAAGRYAVNISCNRPVPDDARDPRVLAAASFVADGFQPDVLVVEEGGDAVTRDFDVPLRK